MPLHYKVLDKNRLVPYRARDDLAPAVARPRARQPPLHPADDGAGGVVHRRPRVGPSGGGGDRARRRLPGRAAAHPRAVDRKSTRLNSSHGYISYSVFFFKKKKNI